MNPLPLLLLLTACQGAAPPSTTDTAPDTGSDCPAGFSGEDCSFCTWTTAGEDCHPGQTADLFDVEAIKAMSLDDLGWELGEVYEGDGVTVITGDILTPFPAVDADGVDVDVTMRTKVAVYVPDGWPDDTPAARQGLAMVAAAHFSGKVLVQTPETIARVAEIPVLYQGEYEENWEQLGFASKKELFEASAGNIVAHNTCEPSDLVRGNHKWLMAAVDLRTITLAQRLAEEAGSALDRFALRGFSKEGGAAWLACMADDRIEVCSPGGNPAGDLVEYSRSFVDPYGCEGDSEEELRAAGSQAAIEWYLGTPAGASLLNRLDMSQNLDHLLAQRLLIDGDVYLPGMHDGENFMLGPETPFLDQLTMVPWRYVRKAEQSAGSDDEDGDEVSTTKVPFLIAEMLVSETPLDDYFTKVEAADASLVGDSLQVTATLSAPTESAVVWWSWSEDRVWNEEGQAEWTSVDMDQSGDSWTGQVDLSGVSDRVIGWYVEARSTLALGGAEYGRNDASPIRVIQEPEALTCEIEVDFCE